MLFSSIPFLFYFLPCVILFYFLSPKKLKNTTLLFFSLLFYAWGEPKYVFLMLFTILINYILALLIEKHRDKPISKLFLVLALIFNFGALAYFKYADFFIYNINRVTGLSIGLLNIALPIGISFYTFQMSSYTIDVYRADTKAQKNIITLAAYVSLFPQLIAGPIVRYSDVERELNKREHSINKIATGIRRFVIGLSKKVILANTLGELCNAFLLSPDKTILFYWLYVIAFMLQVYFDFSGYSDMAIGLGKIFGFNFLENFNYPFISKSISEFWRRWHISLGSWFRDYLYIPLGGNRVAPPKQLFNIFFVWMFTGFWHGAEWNFIIWGLYFAVFLSLEKFFIRKYIEKSKILAYIYTLFFVAISFAIFSADSLGGAIKTVGSMFGAGGIPLISQSFVYNLKSYFLVLTVSVVAATPLCKNAFLSLRSNQKYSRAIDILEIFFLLFLVILVCAYLADGAFNPFLYFRF